MNSINYFFQVTSSESHLPTNTVLPRSTLFCLLTRFYLCTCCTLNINHNGHTWRVVSAFEPSLLFVICPHDPVPKSTVTSSQTLIPISDKYTTARGETRRAFERLSCRLFEPIRTLSTLQCIRCHTNDHRKASVKMTTNFPECCFISHSVFAPSCTQVLALIMKNMSK